MVKFALRSITKLVLVATALASAVPGISGAEDFSKNSKEPPRRWLSNDNAPHQGTEEEAIVCATVLPLNTVVEAAILSRVRSRFTRARRNTKTRPFVSRIGSCSSIPLKLIAVCTAGERARSQACALTVSEKPRCATNPIPNTGGHFIIRGERSTMSWRKL